MDSNGFKAVAFLHFYLCGVVAAFTGYHEGHSAFAAIIASSVFLTTAVLTSLWVHESRARRAGESGADPKGFAPGAAPAAVIVGWVSLAAAFVAQSDHILYAAYIAMLVLLLYRARSMESEESGYRAGLRVS